MKNYLPLGSVVTLKEGNKKLMIYGRRQVMASSGEVFDYVGCFYPEGNISPDYTFLFNDDDIGAIHFRGFEDGENTAFVKDILNNENNGQ